MRTTLALETDAVKAVRSYARRRRVSMGKAASELIRRGARFQLGVKMVNGLPVLDMPDDFPVITPELVKQLQEEQ